MSETKTLWGPGPDGILVDGKTSAYLAVLPDAQLVTDFTWKLQRPTLQQLLRLQEHGAISISDDCGKMFLKVPLRRMRLEGDVFMTKESLKDSPQYTDYARAIAEIKGWRATVEFYDNPRIGWDEETDSPIFSMFKWSTFPGQVKLWLGVVYRPVGNLLGRR